ncbi:hypothetical protein Pla123a_27790 [Posidoniimonas polymericola]|uniref:Bacterial Ig-like domain (Group 2) n=1 Tax=Posidoniimonas polymericola TaxID=2528002 RepID=A0A5C5YLZ4_9BACT|nr:DUF1553 domain-containing protein [Posidoniimonas polymericola]TWT75993.1 hypothetical protein Pla123a_27790 [Posidoniimonas polymericola]
MHHAASILVLACTCVTAVAAVAAEAIDFDTEVLPLLSKAGCNAASCHGSSAGQAGFRLSLFGGDPEFDHRSIAHEFEARRIDYPSPADSLLLAKPTGVLDHGGGEVLEVGGKTAQTIERWIKQGATRRESRTLKRIVVTPTSFETDQLPAEFQLHVLAQFDDRSERRVTADTVYVSQDDDAVQVDPAGRVAVRKPGQQTVIVRFADQVRAVTIVSPLGTTVPELPESSRSNWIDDEINAKLASLRLAPAATASDSEFLRRVSLDLTGRLQAPEVVEKFLADSNPNKRAELIDELLGSDEFIDYWTHRLATQLRVQTPGADTQAAGALYDWLRGQVADGVGWDHIAREIVLSTGDSHRVGAATVHRFFPTAREEAEYMSETLMGVRLRCANCHNHPLDLWTQDDYHGLAAVFAGLERGQVVRFRPGGEVTHPRTGDAAVAKLPGEGFLTREGDSRGAFADWLISRDNPYFARAMSGRVWEALMGRGLVTPVDDLRSTNPPTHPQLLDRLADDFATGGYRLRPLIRNICNSAAYQRGRHTGDTSSADDRFYSYSLPKPLSAEVLADAISDVTGVPDNYAGATRAINVVDRTVSAPKLEFLDQCLPGEACQGEQIATRGVAAQLHLMNGDLLNKKIQDPDGRLALLLQLESSTDQIVREFYLRALQRLPTDAELASWVEQVDSTDNEQLRATRLEDFLWALLNCHEFSTNN